ncbi:MAG: pyruvate ferredoxin oxidoreductase [Deltaproteobacteria bacterium HGW-Deltaproteobacteria-15]|jgi:pyruvate/2-oxoacid:ferredoxin oxidoreductase alpha subunit|nr:MAG: pyruvate ferredoxin oxidoreductase [Deltaproteobacteria bacterium HGW-Deltaproteobacteria-15]
MKKFISGNHAVAEAVRLCRTQVVAAYPITPQTPIYEKLSDWEAAGELGGIMMRTESEHSAMAACLSASLTGARTFTATSSQGIALMHEMLHFASGCRTSVVMACVNRTLAAPWAFWADQTDSLSQRDTGWMQIYCEDNQESFDSTIQAFRIAEKVLLPCMVVLEANFISHFMEPVEVPDQREVDRFVPPVGIPKRFDVDNPGYAMAVVSPTQFEGYRQLSHEAMRYGLQIVEEVDREFKEHFGRGYGLVEGVGVEDAELALVTSGSITSTARVAVANLRKKGLRVGLLKIRLFRPFPTAALRKILDPIPRIAVLERNLSLGREGIFCSELKAALVNSPTPHRIQGYLAGIGGTDVNPGLIERVIMDGLGREQVSDEPVWMREEKV